MTNNKQQTVVEWLFGYMFNPSHPHEEQFKLLEQAKEMEKEQMIDAFDEGQEYEYQYHINSTPKFDSETWYNETYGGGNK